MHMYVMILQKVARRYAPSRALSFDVVHAFAALQMIGNNGTTSRNALCSGLVLCEGLLLAIPAEMSLPKCSVSLSRFNYAVLVKEFGFAVGLGIEQRDAAIKMGATGATTLLFKDNKFVMPANSNDSLKKEP